ncbi:MAG: DUF3466 family protein [Armatimonadota bacterium]
MKVALLSLIAAISVSLWAMPASATVYSLDDLTSSPLGNLRAFYGINSGGDAVGTYYVHTYERAFIRRNGQVQALGTLGGYISVPRAINDFGKVVGYSTLDGSSQPFHAFVWESIGGLHDLGNLNGIGAIANDINNSGQVVGESGTAFIWDAVNGMQSLGTLPGYEWCSTAVAINNNGLVLGYSAKLIDGMPAIHYFLRDNFNGMRDLTAMMGRDVNALDINDLGQVVGYCEGHAFIWDSVSGMQDLGITGGNSYAYGINNRGQVVGEYEAPSGGNLPFVWDKVNGMQNPGTLGGFSNGCLDINDAGVIVGSSSNQSGFRAVQWTPVPEPPSILAILGGLASLLAFRRRKA